ncbi:MAG: DNA polymerase III subunit delta' [Alphaproteobacteria bacterium]|nr:DNA polymerase III subunit delta' [Alphaproteobacteria bacterium]
MDLFGEEPEATGPIETEDFTIPDDLDDAGGFKHPREMDFCLGHEAVEKRLIELFESGRMPHGLIFTGQKGIGKATMAYRLARYLLKDHGDPNQDALFGEPAAQSTFQISPDDTTFRRVASGGHPDFMVVEREYDAAKNRYKDNVPVDAIRKVPGFLRMTASDGGWRVVIIDDADTMNRNAQNALLKVLEEPPKRTVLILVAHRMGALIPTIRSRAQVIHFQPLQETHLQQLIETHTPGLSAQDTQTLKHLCEGSIGRAAEYLEQGGLETLAQILDLMQYYPHWQWEKIHPLADNLARPGADQACKTFAGLMCWLFARLCVVKARGLVPEHLQSFVGNSSLEQLLKICENLHSHFDRVEGANLDKRQGILGAFSIIAA